MVIENELKKSIKFDLIYFRGKSHFEDDVTKNYLIFQRIATYIKTGNVKDINYVLSKLKDCPRKKSILSKQLTIHLIHTLMFTI